MSGRSGAPVAGEQVFADLETMPVAVLGLDLRGVVTWANAAAGMLLSVAPAVLLGTTFAQQFEMADRIRFTRWLLAANEPVFDGRLAIPDAPRLRILRGPPQADPRLRTHVLVLLAGTAPLEVSDRSRGARRDSLTGLAKRETVVQAIEETLARSSLEALAVLFVDLDHFKWVNDSLGHAVGDTVLREVGATLRRLVRSHDLVGRLSGDEFVVVLRDLRGSSGAKRVATAVVSAFSAGMEVDGQHVAFSVSAGLAVAPSDGRDAETLLRRADAAMYAAKQAGRATWRAFDGDLAEDVARHYEVRSRLERALAVDALAICAQPIVRLVDGVTVGHEVLVRMVEDGQLVSPAVFLDVAIRSGLIRALGRWVRHECFGAMALGRLGGRGLGVHINVSPSELHPGLVEELLLDLRAFDVSPEQITIEFTEETLFQRGIEPARLIGELRAAGMRVALDDFGVGYASLGKLIELPIDTVKIDRSLVGDGTQAAVVEAVIGLCRAIGRPAVAEGVETEAQRARLIAAGCEFGQGYLFGRPERVSARFPVGADPKRLG